MRFSPSLPTQALRAASGALAAGLTVLPSPTWAQAQPAAAVATPPPQAVPDNGTDPARVRRTATLNFEHTDLRDGFSSEVFEAFFSQPVGPHSAIQATVPLSSVNVAGNNGFGLGDIELEVTHIPVVTRTHAIVVKGAFIGDSASRPELGLGNNSLQATLIYVRFLRGGALLAPSFQQTYGVERDAGRTRVNNLTIDLYFVPHLNDPNYYMTIDPALIIDWERGTQYGAFSVTLGRTLGPALGGRAQIYLKPSVYAGADRLANWGLEFGVKLLGF